MTLSQARLYELAVELRRIADELAGDPTAPHAGVLPADWHYSQAMYDEAIGKYPSLDIVHETDRFRHHHQSRGTCYLDWNKAWWGWLAKSAEFVRRDGRTKRAAATATRAQQTSRENDRRTRAALARFDEVPDPPAPERG